MGGCYYGCNEKFVVVKGRGPVGGWRPREKVVGEDSINKGNLEVLNQLGIIRTFNVELHFLKD